MTKKRTIKWSDPLRKLVVKKQALPAFKERWWAILFKHSDGWTISALEARRETAFNEMKRQKSQSPDFKYKVASCTVGITQSQMKAPPMV